MCRAGDSGVAERSLAARMASTCRFCCARPGRESVVGGIRPNGRRSSRQEGRPEAKKGGRIKSKDLYSAYSSKRELMVQKGG